jgi:hypothetical protein
MEQRLEEEARKRVEQELLVARRIQQASLPKAVPKLEGWQVASYYQPAWEVGGDFYDFHLLHGGGLGAGGRHHPPYATTLRIPKLNFREFVFHALCE